MNAPESEALPISLVGGPCCGEDGLKTPPGKVCDHVEMPEFRKGVDGKRYVHLYVKHDMLDGTVIYRYAGPREDIMVEEQDFPLS